MRRVGATMRGAAGYLFHTGGFELAWMRYGILRSVDDPKLFALA